MEEEENFKQILEDITTKVDELSKALKAGGQTEEVQEEGSKKLAQIKEKIADLTKSLEEVRKGAVEKKIDIENKIKEYPILCLAGAFIGGIIIGRLTRNNKD